MIFEKEKKVMPERQFIHFNSFRCAIFQLKQYVLALKVFTDGLMLKDVDKNFSRDFKKKIQLCEMELKRPQPEQQEQELNKEKKQSSLVQKSARAVAVEEPSNESGTSTMSAREKNNYISGATEIAKRAEEQKNFKVS